MALADGARSVWQNAVLALYHLSPKSALYVCSGLFALIAIADLLTPPQLNLSLLYVFVILLATWNAGIAAGAAFAVASALMQWIVLSQHAAPILHSVYWYFWLANRWVTFLAVVALTHPLRILFERHRTTARIDSLTGAANQKYFHDMLQMELTRSGRSGEPFAVVFMDCDKFKLVNDQHGHVVGDSVLRTVVDTAKRLTRNSDTVARLGGDEFAILLPNVTSENARVIVTRLQSKLHEKKIDRQWTATLSIGLATFEKTELDPDGVIALCDSLMYRAKRSGAAQIAHEHFPAPADQGTGLAFDAIADCLVELPKT